MTKHYIYKVNKKTILEKISHLKPINYNPFRWWRRFDTPNKPLNKHSSLIDKIKNGDYDFSHFYWQAKYTEIEINELYNECYPDHTLFNEKNSMGGARRKRLWDDFEKDEKEKLLLIERDFHTTFKMSRNQVKEELEEFGGTLEDFYIYCKNQYRTRQRKLETRGRPRKII
jgi:hypothetical protein